MYPVYDINNEQVKNIMSVEEDFLNDIKAKKIKPARLSETVSAFSNAPGEYGCKRSICLENCWSG